MKSLLVSFLIGAASVVSSHAQLQGSSLNKPAERVTPYHAGQICAAYEKNQLSADAALKGKKVVVTGRISKIEGGGTPTIEMSHDGKSVHGLRCEIAPEFLAEAGKLKSGATIVIDGVVAGLAGHWVSLTNCTRHR
jgi:hypothetical protein